MKVTKVMCLVIGVFVVTYTVYAVGANQTQNMTGSCRLWIQHIITWIWEVRYPEINLGSREIAIGFGVIYMSFNYESGCSYFTMPCT